MNDQAIIAAIGQRGIQEVVHFTTNNGLVGILHTGRLSANANLRAEQRLAHIMKINSADRSRDSMWLGYVNLSISRINDYFFRYSKNRVNHEHAYWCILSFDPIILAHPGVYFATTNNAYELTKRETGLTGLEALFSGHIRRKPAWDAYRPPTEQTFHPTCRQAEALYPAHVSLTHLQRIYVPDGNVYDEVFAQVSMLAPQLRDRIQIIIDQNKFA